MADKETPEAPENSESKMAAPKKSTRKAPVKKAAAKKAAAKNTVASKTPEQVTVQDMHRLLTVLENGLASRDKTVDHLQQQIALNQEQVVQNKQILAKRAFVGKWVFALMAIGMGIIGFDQHTIVKSFDRDMTIVAKDMDVMMKEMTAMRIAMESMSQDMHSMSGDFSIVAKDVSAIAKDVRSMSHGVQGMSHDTRDMNRHMDTMTPPWSPFR